MSNPFTAGPGEMPYDRERHDDRPPRISDICEACGLLRDHTDTCPAMQRMIRVDEALQALKAARGQAQ